MGQRDLYDHDRSISLILFAVEFLNLVGECILGWKSVRSHFRVTVTLTSYLVARICLESSAYLSNFRSRNPKTWCIDASLDGYISCTFFGHCDLEI